MAKPTGRDVEADEGQAPPQDKLNQIFAGILQRSTVAAARQNADTAKARVGQLTESQQRLRARSAEISEEIRGLGAMCRRFLIEQYAGAENQPDVGEHLRRLPALEREHGVLTEAVVEIGEHLLPNAEVADLRAAAEFCSTQAEALREVTADRMDKTQKLMASAAEHEGEITFDPARTVSGVLLAQANQLEIEAANRRRIAHEREEEYLRAQRQKAKIS